MKKMHKTSHKVIVRDLWYLWSSENKRTVKTAKYFLQERSSTGKHLLSLLREMQCLRATA